MLKKDEQFIPFTIKNKSEIDEQRSQAIDLIENLSLIKKDDKQNFKDKINIQFEPQRRSVMESAVPLLQSYDMNQLDDQDSPQNQRRITKSMQFQRGNIGARLNRSVIS